MKNAMQLKAAVKRFATQNNTSAQVALQLYMMESLLSRISLSRYQKNFVIKGGFLISSLIGIRNRTTMDIDATVVDTPVSAMSIKAIFDEICSGRNEEEPEFKIKLVAEIRENDEYGGFRVSLSCLYGTLNVPLKFDITVGDAITPGYVEYEHQPVFIGKRIRVYAYNIETVLAEKLETVLSRGIQNTRMRDCYDIHKLVAEYAEQINRVVLALALRRTAAHRNTLDLLESPLSVIASIMQDAEMAKRWEDYRRSYKYAAVIDFQDVCKSMAQILESLVNKEQG